MENKELLNIKKENKRLLKGLESHDIIIRMILDSLFDYNYDNGEFKTFKPKKSLFYSRIKSPELEKKSYFG